MPTNVEMVLYGRAALFIAWLFVLKLSSLQLTMQHTQRDKSKQMKRKKELILICLSFLCRNKFVEFDMKPVCKKCYEKFPLELKKRLKKLAESLGRK